MRIIPFIVLCAFALPVPAVFAQHSDVLLADVNGQVDIGSAVDPSGPNEEFSLGTTTFESILVPGSAPVNPVDYESDEPGFFGLDAVGNVDDLTALGASALPGAASVSISASSFAAQGANAALFYWDGTGGVSFAPAPAGTTFAFNPANDFAMTDANGGMDDHPFYELNAAAGTPADGVYLVSPVIDVAGLESSDPFYIVLLADALITGEEDAELVEEALEDLEEGLAADALVDFGGGITKDFAFYEEAVEFVEETIAIPEPSSALLCLAGSCVLALMQSRSRR